MANKKSKSAVEKEYYKNRNRVQRFMREAEKRGYSFQKNTLPDVPKKITQASVNRLKKLTPKELYKKSIAFSPKTGKLVPGTVARMHEQQIAAQKAAETRAYNALIKEMAGIQKPTKKTQKPETTETHYKTGLSIYSDEEIPDDVTGEQKPETTYKIDLSSYSDEEIPDDVYETLRNVREMLSEWIPDSTWTPSLERAKTHDKNVLQSILNGAIASEGEKAVALRMFEKSDRIIDLVTNILYASGSKEGNFKDGRTQVNADIAAISSIIMGRALTVEESKQLTDIMESTELNN